jgi:anti-repressor protein
VTALETFSFDEMPVRKGVVDGEPVFVGKDTCDALGVVKYRDALAQLDDDERVSIAVDTPGGRQQMIAVTEAGLYSLMLISRSPKVNRFKRWVTHEVIPQLRRTGSYSVQHQIPQTYAAALRLAADETERAEKAERQIAIDAPKVEAFDNLMDADGYYDFLSAGKILGVGRTTLFRRLREIGVLIPNTRMPYERYAHHFKVTVSTWTDPDGFVHKTETTRIRPSALPFLAKKLDASGEPLRLVEGGVS